MIRVKVYVYLGKIRCYIFLVNSRYMSEVRRKGRKRVLVNFQNLRLIRLFKRGRPILKKIHPDEEFLMPNKEFEFSVPEYKLREC